jgi:hypothetical protein
MSPAIPVLPLIPKPNQASSTHGREVFPPVFFRPFICAACVYSMWASPRLFLPGFRPRTTCSFLCAAKEKNQKKGGPECRSIPALLTAHIHVRCPAGAYRRANRQSCRLVARIPIRAPMLGTAYGVPKPKQKPKVKNQRSTRPKARSTAASPMVTDYLPHAK